MITAEQRLFAARKGWVPGWLLSDCPPSPVMFAHPFLVELQLVASHLQAEVKKLKAAGI